jgi:hypothetical protein
MRLRELPRSAPWNGAACIVVSAWVLAALHWLTGFPPAWSWVRIAIGATLLATFLLWLALLTRDALREHRTARASRGS